jgi:BMFP domain-containing protein YqiC
VNQGPNRIFDELAKLMSDGAGLAQGVKREAEAAFRAQAEGFLANMDLVKREEFDVVREMASRAREENEVLRKELDALKKLVASKSRAAKKS